MCPVDLSDRDLEPKDLSPLKQLNEWVYARWMSNIFFGKRDTFHENRAHIRDTLSKLREGHLITEDGHKLQILPPLSIFFTIRRPAKLELQQPVVENACRDTYQNGYQQVNPYFHMATPMLTADERCYKRVGKDNRGLHQFVFML